MTIKENQIDALNLSVEIILTEEDYAAPRKKKLSEYRRGAEIKGFRKGMVPASLIEKMYGQRALIDVVNDLLSNSLYDHIKEKNYNLVGEPLASDATPEVDFTYGSEMTFLFDMALQPVLDFDLDPAADKVAYYKIEKTAEAVAEKKAQLLQQYGSLVEVEEAGEEAFITVDLTAGEESVLDAYVAIRSVSEECKSQFLGLKVGDSIDVDVAKAFTNETDRAALLKVEKSELDSIPAVWKMTVNTVKSFAPATVCQETFDKIFGQGIVSSEEEFDAKVSEVLDREYDSDAKMRLSNDVKAYIRTKAAVEVPEAFLKRWITKINEDRFSAEEIEKDFPEFLEGYKWDVVRDYLCKKYGIEFTEEDYLASAKGYASYQFAMYGLTNVPEEEIENYAKNLLQDERMSGRIVEAVKDEKAITAAQAHISLEETPISLEAFRAL